MSSRSKFNGSLSQVTVSFAVVNNSSVGYHGLGYVDFDLGKLKKILPEKLDFKCYFDATSTSAKQGSYLSLNYRIISYDEAENGENGENGTCLKSMTVGTAFGNLRYNGCSNKRFRTFNGRCFANLYV